MNERDAILRHLDSDYTEPIRDPIWKHIYLSRSLMRIVQALPFQQLNDIKQLGLTYLIYPGATHTRFNHSLGVFHLARQMIIHLIKKPIQPPLTLTGVKAFLCAALLHDLGHYPFAHSLKELDIKDHETLTAEAIMNNVQLNSLISESLAVPPKVVAAIINLKSSAPPGENIPFFRKLLSGVLDPDKLDYLNRDAYFCGIPYGIQDIDFIFSQISPHRSKGVCISRKGLTSVESILFSKYLMYRNVYWHRKVRVVTAMIKKAILLGLRAGAIAPGDLYGIDDQEFFSLMESSEFAPFELVRKVSRREFFIPVYSLPFSENNPLHRKIEDLEERLEFEGFIASKLSRTLDRPVLPEEIVIDIPERISFEIDVPILDRGESVSYKESGSVFSTEVIRGFTNSLRTISILAVDEKKLTDKLKKIQMVQMFSSLMAE